MAASSFDVEFVRRLAQITEASAAVHVRAAGETGMRVWSYHGMLARALNGARRHRLRPSRSRWSETQ